jgi:hypothetical protein
VLVLVAFVLVVVGAVLDDHDRGRTDVLDAL